MNGLNIQYPWSKMIIDGKKTVETRSYPLPKKYEGEELALIETPGKAGNFKSRIIGTVTFSHSFKYPNETCWKEDQCRHLVGLASEFGWNENKDKYGWVICAVHKFDEPVEAPTKKGIIFTNDCNVLMASGV